MAHNSKQELKAHLKKNAEDRKAEYAKKYGAISMWITKVLETPLESTLGVPCERDDLKERLQLLCLLFDYSSKSERKENKG